MDGWKYAQMGGWVYACFGCMHESVNVLMCEQIHMLTNACVDGYMCLFIYMDGWWICMYVYLGSSYSSPCRHRRILLPSGEENITIVAKLVKAYFRSRINEII